MRPPSSLYLHVPFCRHRCGYCNFTLVAGRDHLIDAYLDAVETEINSLPSAKLDTVFVGGGTPTHLSTDQMARLFGLVKNKFELASGIEFSVEGNPCDFDLEKVEFLDSQNVNRISLGVQSFQPQKLSTLERDHSREVVLQATELIRKKIPNLSIDLIFGVSGESIMDWEDDLRMAMACKPMHVSTYSLTIEKGTRFWNAQNRNLKMQVEDDLAIELYEIAIDFLGSFGFTHYEVSNFAKTGFECTHNINYWNGGEYFGVGPGAARYVAGARQTNHQSTMRYIKLVSDGQDPTIESEKIDAEQRAREILIFGLRQINGFLLNEFRHRTGYTINELAEKEIKQLMDQDLISLQHDRLKLTRKGLLVSDSIWPELI